MMPPNTYEPIARSSAKPDQPLPVAEGAAQSEDSEDHALLSAYVNGSERAFTSLVRRYIDLVYSAACRQVQDAHAAADVTNSVFMVLARKAAELRPGVVIAAWLHSTTRFAALKAIRARARREHYEQEAVRMQQIFQNEEPSAAWEEIAPWLDESLSRLSRKDHEAVILRFFQKKSFPEIAATVGSTEEAARKRVDRAVRKLRDFLAYRGVILSGQVLGGSLAHAVRPSPPALASAIRLSGLTLPGSTIPLLVSETLQTLRWRFWKPIFATGVVLLLAFAALALVRRTYISPSPVAPLSTFRLLNEAANEGDGDRWASFIHVTTSEEQHARDLLGSNVVAQAELRRVLLQRFGQADYEQSVFPRLFDETPETQIATVVQTINGDEATLHFLRGSNLKFIYVKGTWKFDFFRTTSARPAQLLSSLEIGLARLSKLEARIRAGEFASSPAAANAYQSMAINLR